MRSNVRKSETEPEDDGTGEMTVWRIETGDKENELREIAREDYGEFFGGDCYIIKYYNHNAKPKVSFESLQSSRGFLLDGQKSKEKCRFLYFDSAIFRPFKIKFFKNQN